MRTFTLTFLITLLSFFSYSQQKTIVSNLDNLSLSIGDSYTPITFVLDSDGKKADCNRMIYYNKRGVFSSAKSITVDNETGTITANEPGKHEVVAICFGEGGKRMSKTFNVNVKYPKVKEIKLSINASKIYAFDNNQKARSLALELNDALKVLSTFDEGPDLVLFYKYLLKLKGEDEYNFNFYESDKLSVSQSIFAKKQFKLFNEWWQTWNQ